MIVVDARKLITRHTHSDRRTHCAEAFKARITFNNGDATENYRRPPGQCWPVFSFVSFRVLVRTFKRTAIDSLNIRIGFRLAAAAVASLLE